MSKKRVVNSLASNWNRQKFQSTAKRVINDIKNPKTEYGAFAKRVAMGIGICSIGIAASLLGLR